MSTFFLFSPEQSEIDTDEETPTTLPKSAFSETFTPQSIKIQRSKPDLPKRKPKHPSYAVMVDEAVYNVGVYKKGSSLFAVKKFIQEKYELDMKYAAKRIKSVIRDALENGRYVKTSGRGLTGRFRLAIDTRKMLKTKYKTHPFKPMRINLKTNEEKPMLLSKRRNNQTNSGLHKTNRKRKANPIDTQKAEEIKKARTLAPALMRAMD